MKTINWNTYGRVFSRSIIGVVTIVALMLPFFPPQVALADISVVSATLDGGSSTTVAPSASVEVELTVNRQPNNSGSDNDWESTFVDIIPDGLPGLCIDTPDHDFGAGVDTENFDITAPGAADAYDVLIEIYRGPNCNGQERDSITFEDGIVVEEPTASISGIKVHDLNNDGNFDDDEPFLEGWTIELYDDEGLVAATTTDSGGDFSFEDLATGETYTVCEVQQDGWSQTFPVANDGCYVYDPLEEDVDTAFFGNYEEPVYENGIKLFKSYDINGDGVFANNDERRLGGWTFRLYDDQWSQVGSDEVTPEEWPRTVSFENLAPGDYQVCEVLQDSWSQTYVESHPNGSSYGTAVTNGSGESDEGETCFAFSIDEEDNLNARFGNVWDGARIIKFLDANQDGLYDNNQDSRLGDWTFRLYDDSWSELDVDTTDTEWPKTLEFLNLEADETYRFCEVLPEGWYQTGIDTWHFSEPTPIGYGTTVANGSGAGDEAPLCYEIDRSEYPGSMQIAFGNTNQVPEPGTAKVIAHKIVCDAEEYLPDWAPDQGSPTIDENTAADFVAQNSEHCRFVEGWDFQWASPETANPGDNSGEAGEPWMAFGPTDANGMTMTEIEVGDEWEHVWVREVLKDGYIPFTGASDEDPVSAEFYCHIDSFHYDNWDRVDGITEGNTYYCVAFNVPDHQCVPDEELVSNGSFENPLVTHQTGWDIFPDGTSGLEWAVEWVAAFAGAPETANAELHGGVNGWLPFLGEQYAELDSDWNGHAAGPNGEEASTRLSQTLETVPGETYTLSFAFSPRPGQDDSENVLKVFWGGNEEDELTADGTGNGNTDWETRTYEFEATDWFTELAFEDAGTPNAQGTFLDDVSVMCQEPAPVTECNDGINNDDDDYIDHPDDPGCESPEDDDESDDPRPPQIVYGAYCGDGIENQEWEQCDNDSDSCTEQCQLAENNQCTDLVLARIVVENDVEADNDGNGDATSDIFLGDDEDANRIPHSAWFLVHQNGTYVTDPNNLGSYEDVEGLAVRRRGDQQDVRTRLHGSHAEDGDLIYGEEHVDGYLEFWSWDGSVVPTRMLSQAGQNKVENPFNNTTGGAGNDELDNFNETDLDDERANFWITVTTADDGFITRYSDVPQCDNGGGNGSSDGSITIVKVADPDDGTDFDFSFDEGSFSLDDEGSDTDEVPGSETFDELSAGEYTFSESVPEGWVLSNIECSGDEASEVVIDGSTVTIDLAEGEDITCTFFNVAEDDSSNEEVESVTTSGGGTSYRRGGGSTGGQVLGATTECGPYLNSFLHIGLNNPQEEVNKLRVALNQLLGLNLPIAGPFNQSVFSAVQQFQSQYGSDVLGPWGISEPTGYVYITTRRLINNLMCPTLAIPLPVPLVPDWTLASRI